MDDGFFVLAGFAALSHHRPGRGGVDPREISPCRRRSAATTPRRRHDGAAAPPQHRDAEKTEKNDVKIMQNGPKMSQNGPKNNPKRFENDSKRAEKRFFYFVGGAISLSIYPPRRRG